MASKKIQCVVVLMCMVVLGALVSEAAISCGEISSALFPCVVYLTTGVPEPSGICCDGVTRVNNAANTTPDRQDACRCLKGLAGGISNLNLDKAEGLPAKCSVNIPYKISPSTDCDSIQL